MPRNSAGVYSLPAGNPVVTGTVISSTWANTTLADIGNELTQSLDRSGDGGMLAGLQLFSGTIGAPGLTWSAETTSGLYRSAAGDFRWAIGGADKFQIITTGVGTAAGAVGTPGLFFITDSNTGLYSVGADDIGFSTGGVLRLDISSTAITATIPFLAAVGAVGAPGISFVGDSNTGFYSAVADRINISLGGVDSVLFYSGGLQLNAAGMGFFAQNGTAAAPTLSFANDSDTGIYRFGANTLGFSTQGTVRATLDNNQWNFANGSAALPVLAFSNDADTGIYLVSAGPGVIGFSCDGTQRLSVSGTNIIFSSPTMSYANQTLNGTANAGGATLPANPVGFWQVALNGTTRNIPYYAV